MKIIKTIKTDKLIFKDRRDGKEYNLINISIIRKKTKDYIEDIEKACLQHKNETPKLISQDSLNINYENIGYYD